MKLEQQVCSLELAKRLKELGVKQESLCYWAGDTLTIYNYAVEDELPPTHWSAAFTVAELGEMLPSGRYELVSDHIKRWALWKSEQGFSAKTEADARAKMLIYLLENNLLTK